MHLLALNKKLRSSGFSLVELMTAVAIVGILFAMAVPQVMKYSAKSRQSEAKSHLSLLYTCEKTFQGEYSVFDPNFFLIGFGIVGGTHYNVGFASGGDTAATTATGADIPTALSTARELITYCPQSFSSKNLLFERGSKFAFLDLLLPKANAGAGGGGGGGGGGAPTSCWIVNGADSNPPDAIDTVGAGYVISGGGTLYLAAATARIFWNGISDVWSIDQNKTLSNVQNGLQ